MVLTGVKKFLYRCGTAAIVVVKYGCIIHCVTTYGLFTATCIGDSMEPTIHHGDVYLVEAVSVFRNRLKMGDIVGVRSHRDPNLYVCKRIAGLNGDVLFDTTTYEAHKIPKGHVWLEGDNKECSIDSRSYGPIPYGLIKYRLFYKVWSGKSLHAR